MRSIVRSSLKSRFLVVAVAAALLVFGIVQLRTMPVDVLPEFAPPFVEIQTEALGLSAEEVEALITIPLEQDLLNGVAWLQTIRSESVPGLSSIVLVFQPGTDLLRARQLVAERLTQAFALPHVSKAPAMLQPLSSSSRVMIVGLSSKSLSLIQLSVLARWTIGPRLSGVPGVANVSVWGNRDRQLQVLVDPKRMLEQKVPLLQVLETTGNALWVSSLSFVEASTPGTGGFIDTPNQRLAVRHVSPIVTANGLAQIPISDRKKSDGTPLRLGDIANVVEDNQPLIGDAIGNEGSSLLLVIEKFPGSSTLGVTRGVEQAFAALRPGLPGVEIDSTIFRPADFIETATNNVALAVLIGLVLVVLVLAAFFFNWRTVLISLVAIPLSLVAGGLVLYLRGATMNAIVLAGFVIAVGVVVDDVIIDVENIARRLRQHRKEGTPHSAAHLILRASLEMRGPIIFATLIVLVAILPVFFLGGLLGAFFQPLALAYALAVLASMAVALTVTPVLCLILLANVPIEQRPSPLSGRLQTGYDKTLSRILHRPSLAFLTVGVIVLAGVIGLATLSVLPSLGQSLLPNFKDRNLFISLNSAPGTSQPEMSRIAALIGREVRAIPGVRNFGAHVGRAVRGDQVVSVNSSEIWISIDPAADYDKTLAAIQQVVDGYPGIQRDVQTYLAERSGEVGAGTDDSIVVRIFGHDLQLLRRKAEEMRQTLAGVNGIVDSRVKVIAEEPILEVEVNLAQAQRLGIKPGEVRRAAATLLSGLQVGNLFEDQKVFDVVVWSTPETRNSLSSIRDLLIDTPSGGNVRLADVADVRIRPAPQVIQRDAVSRYIDVSASVRGRDLASVTSDIQSRLHQLQFPLEYHAEVLRDSSVRQAAQTRLWVFVGAALLAIFFLLQAAVGRLRLALLAFLTLPAALVGGLLAAVAAGVILSLGSLLGFFTVFGIAARNTILLINHYQHLERSEGEVFGLGLVLRGTNERLTPILMTAVATGLALVPVLLLGDIPGLEIVRPLAVVVLGGLVTSTLLNLFIVPALYLHFRISPVPDLELETSTLVDFGAMLGGAPAVSSMDAGK